MSQSLHLGHYSPDSRFPEAFREQIPTYGRSYAMVVKGTRDLAHWHTFR
jgi:hypothetical protein